MDVGDARLLEARVEQIWEIAQRFGLDPYPVHFELVPATIMHEFGAYGLPGRFSHWTHGRAYQQLKTMYDYGLSKIYELVINTNPAYAFLVDNNSVLQNKVVVAHVLGHVDFFKHNAYFAPTNRQMIEGASVNAERIRGYEYAHGQREVEEFLDAVLSIQEHIDPGSRVRADRPPTARPHSRRARANSRTTTCSISAARSGPSPSRSARSSPPSRRRTCCSSSPTTRAISRTGSAT